MPPGRNGGLLGTYLCWTSWRGDESALHPCARAQRKGVLSFLSDVASVGRIELGSHHLTYTMRTSWCGQHVCFGPEDCRSRRWRSLNV